MRVDKAGPGRQQQTIKNWRLWIGIIVSIVAIWLALRDIPLSELSTVLVNADPRWIFGAVVIQIVALITRGIRWRVILEEVERPQLPFWVMNIGYLFNNIFPLRAGEAVRAYLMAENSGMDLVFSATSIVLERMMDILLVLVVLVLILPFMNIPPSIQRVALIMGIVVGLFVIFVIIIQRYNQALRRLGRRILDMFRIGNVAMIGKIWEQGTRAISLISQPQKAFSFLFWSILSWGLSIGLYWCVLLGFQPLASPIEASFMVVSLALAMTVPSSPGYLGVFQLVGQQALVIPFGEKYDLAVGFSVALVSHLVFYVCTSIFGMLGIWQTSVSMAVIRQRLKDDGLQEEN
jgi:uncharacterized protein (TIRG00374 family)